MKSLFAMLSALFAGAASARYISESDYQVQVFEGAAVDNNNKSRRLGKGGKGGGWGHGGWGSSKSSKGSKSSEKWSSSSDECEQKIIYNYIYVPIPAPAPTMFTSFWGAWDGEFTSFWGAWDGDSWGGGVGDDYSWGKSGKGGWEGWSGKSGKGGWGGWSGKSGKSGWDGDSWGGGVGDDYSWGKSGKSGWGGSSGKSGKSGWGGSSGKSGKSGWGGSGKSGKSGWDGDSWGGGVGDDYSWGKSGKSGWGGWSGKSGKGGWGGWSGKSGKGGWGGWSGNKSGKGGWGGSGKSGKSGWGGSGKSGKAGVWEEYPEWEGYPKLLLPKDKSTAIDNQFLVILDQDCTDVAGQIGDLIKAVNSHCPGPEAKPLSEPWNINDEFKGQLVQMTITHAHDMASMVGVSFIQQDRYLKIDLPTVDEKGWREVQTGDNLSWGLDRIDQIEGLDGRYNYDYTGRGVTAYVIDSGIDKNHVEFQGRILGERVDFSDDDGPTENCREGSGDHGTHVAGTIGGTTSGVAKKVNFVDVRVFQCDGGTTDSAFERAVNFVANHFKQRGGPAVANASLHWRDSPARERAVRAMRNAGVLLVDAAGNDGVNACNQFPAESESTFTVASINKEDIIYVRYDKLNAGGGFQGSNWGSCVNMFAPGVDIVSAKLNSRNEFTTKSGTSMAAPHVAGAAALILQQHPNWTPDEVSTELINRSTKGVVKAETSVEIERLAETVNRLLFVPTMSSQGKSGKIGKSSTS